MPLRLHPDGLQVFDNWREQRRPSAEAEQLVVEVLRAVANLESWQLRWFSYTDISDSNITIIEPLPGLTVHVRLWTEDPEQFTLIRILGEESLAKE